jgi:hypothetical protein
LYRQIGLDMTTMPTHTLSVWVYHNPGYAGSADRLQVQVSIDGGNYWLDAGTPITRYDGSTGWKKHQVDLSAYAGQTDLRLGLLGISRYGDDVHVDDLSMIECRQPAGGLVVGNAYAYDTGAALAGVVVRGSRGWTTTATTGNPAAPGAFYTLFAPDGTQVFTATKVLYAAVVTSTQVVPGGVTRLDWRLSPQHARLDLPIVYR